jgi:uncharacterized repeat protein (TIGR03803 family)
MGEGREFRMGLLGSIVAALVAGFSSPTAAQRLTTLYSFGTTGGDDGTNPFGRLIADGTGNLYGVTGGGGLIASGYAHGTVFKLTPSGALTVLYSFSGGSDGSTPFWGLIADALGNLYGTTGGSHRTGMEGTVFKLTPPTAALDTWTESVLYRFCSTPCSNGAAPFGGLLADAAGDLYGTSVGASDYGTLFKLTPPTALGDPWTRLRCTASAHWPLATTARIPIPA